MTEFEMFWTHYPLKKGKGAARKKFETLKKNKILPDITTLITAIQDQQKEKNHLKNQNQFVPEWKHPSTWLNKECWNDECILPYQRPEKPKSSYTINTVHRAYDVLVRFGDEKFQEFCAGARITEPDKEAILYRYYCNFDVKKLARGIG